MVLSLILLVALFILWANVGQEWIQQMIIGLFGLICGGLRAGFDNSTKNGFHLILRPDGSYYLESLDGSEINEEILEVVKQRIRR